MIADDPSPPGPGSPPEPSDWPVVPPAYVGVDDYEYDLAYMGVYLRLDICNRSPYLVREATLRVDGLGPGVEGAVSPKGVVTSREIRVGPLFPGVLFREELGIGAPGGITGLSFETVAADAVKLTPPDQMAPAEAYPDLAAEILGVTREEDATTIRVRVRNSGPATVERVRLSLRYFEARGETATGASESRRDRVAEWILDMPRRDWDPYRLPGPPEAAHDPAEPLLPGRSHEFTLIHRGGGPQGWAGRLAATAVEVSALKLKEK